MGTAAVQGALWGTAPDHWVRLQEAAFAPLYAAAFDAADVAPGTRLIDIGCGAGLALDLAVQRGASVTGLDAAAALIAHARTRLPEADLRIGELEELPFPDHGFDVACGFNAFQYASDRVRALAEARRVTKPGGQVIAAIWGTPEQCEARGFFAALGRLGPPPPPGAPGPWALSPPGALEDLMAQAGLTIETSGAADVVFAMRNDEEAADGFLASGPAERVARHAGREATRQAIIDGLADQRRPDGSYALKNTMRFVIARA
jgi:SAM-dependent methyltransferase